MDAETTSEPGDSGRAGPRGRLSGARPGSRRVRYSSRRECAADLALARHAATDLAGRAAPDRGGNGRAGGRFSARGAKGAIGRTRRRRFRLRERARPLSAPASCGNASASTSSSASSTRRCARWTSSGCPSISNLLTQYQNGLILVTGSVGSGKSTTLAALVEQVNQRAARAHHHAGGSDRIHLRAERLPRHPARSAHAYALVRRGAAGRASRRSGRDHGRGNARPGNDLARHHRLGNRPSRPRHAAHRQRLAHARSRARRFPGRSAGADPHHGQRIAARHHQPATRARAPMAPAASSRSKL